MTRKKSPAELASNREYMRRWRAADPERARDKQRAWRAAHPGYDRARYAARRSYYHSRYLEHPERTAAQARAWRLANVDRSRELVRRSHAKRRAANPEAVRGADRKWRRNNPDRVAELKKRWNRANPEKVAAMMARARARRARAPGGHTAQQWKEKKALFANCCAYCGEEKLLTRDHNIPLIRGGSDDISNILPACVNCNCRKGTRTAREYFGLVA